MEEFREEENDVQLVILVKATIPRIVKN